MYIVNYSHITFTRSSLREFRAAGKACHWARRSEHQELLNIINEFMLLFWLIYKGVSIEILKLRWCHWGEDNQLVYLGFQTATLLAHVGASCNECICRAASQALNPDKNNHRHRPSKTFAVEWFAAVGSWSLSRRQEPSGNLEAKVSQGPKTIKTIGHRWP